MAAIGGCLTLLVILAVLGAIWAIWRYNNLISLRNQVANGWKQIDVQLKRRHDLIPNLVAAVKGEMQFEQDTLEKVILFTAFATWDPGKVARHKLFIRANESVGVEVVYGEFKRKDKHCRVCKGKYQTFEEKQTDVNIALSLFRLAVTDQYDRAVIVSGDTDLIPSIKAVRAT